MIDTFEKAMQVTEDETVRLSQSMKDLVNKKLVLGMTEYMCRNGTLSDGHEKITDAQRYFQAIKEMWYISNNIIEQKAKVLEAKADLSDVTGMNPGFRREAAFIRATNKLTQTLVQIEDSMRQLRAFDKVRRELEPVVDAKYPEGIEQAEEDNWIAVAEYRATLRKMGGTGINMTHLPLEQKKKAELGTKLGCPDMTAWLIVDKKQEVISGQHSGVTQYLDFKFGAPERK